MNYERFPMASHDAWQQRQPNRRRGRRTPESRLRLLPNCNPSDILIVLGEALTSIPVCMGNGNWVCCYDGCRLINYPRRKVCHSCGTPRDPDDASIVWEYVLAIYPHVRKWLEENTVDLVCLEETTRDLVSWLQFRYPQEVAEWLYWRAQKVHTPLSEFLPLPPYFDEVDRYDTEGVHNGPVRDPVTTNPPNFKTQNVGEDAEAEDERPITDHEFVNIDEGDSDPDACTVEPVSADAKDKVCRDRRYSEPSPSPPLFDNDNYFNLLEVRAFELQREGRQVQESKEFRTLYGGCSTERDVGVAQFEQPRKQEEFGETSADMDRDVGEAQFEEPRKQEFGETYEKTDCLGIRRHTSLPVYLQEDFIGNL